jgi:uncharacterized protein (TIGR03067 family)
MLPNSLPAMTTVLLSITICHVPLQARAPAPFPAENGKRDHKRIQGTWRVKEVHANGKHLVHEISDDQVWVITKDRITIHYPGGHTDEFTYKLVPSATPRTIDLTPVPGSARRTAFLAIYDLQSNRLKVCRSRGTRPTRLLSGAVRRGQVLFVLDRERK